MKHLRDRRIELSSLVTGDAGADGEVWKKIAELNREEAALREIVGAQVRPDPNADAGEPPE